MFNSPDALFLNISADVFLKSMSITASETLASGMSTRVSPTIAGLDSYASSAVSGIGAKIE